MMSYRGKLVVLGVVSSLWELKTNPIILILFNPCSTLSESWFSCSQMQGAQEKLYRSFTSASHLHWNMCQISHSFWFLEFTSQFLATFPLYSLVSLREWKSQWFAKRLCFIQGSMDSQRDFSYFYTMPLTPRQLNTQLPVKIHLQTLFLGEISLGSRELKWIL